MAKTKNRSGNDRAKAAAAIAKVLGTDQLDEQLNRLRNLVTLASTPVLSVIVQFDQRTQRLSLATVGAKATHAEVRQVLFKAIEQLQKQEDAQAQHAQAAPPAQAESLMPAVSQDAQQPPASTTDNIAEGG